MTPKQATLEKLGALKPEPKHRRTPTEQALVPLLKQREKLVTKCNAAQASLDAATSELESLDKVIRVVKGEE